MIKMQRILSSFARAVPFAAAAALLLAPASAQAHKELGRMWTFEAAPVGWFQQAYDWQPTPEWLDHARMSSLRFGNVDDKQPSGYRFFCSASFVTPHGLVMTNHHCARDAIAKVQGAADWLKDGFYAGAYENEVKLPGFVMTQLVRTQDVTKAVAEHGAELVAKQAKEADPELMHQVIGLYQGGNYQLYSFRLFDDLRLVCAPHGQVAHFGGDPDNFCYPRWGLDFTFVRIWVDGKPFDSAKHFFPWKSDGAKDGELVLVTGNPGSTGRLQTVAQCEYIRDHRFPTRLAQTVQQLEEMHAKAKDDPAYEKEKRAEILRLENTRKAVQGYLDGLRNPRIMQIKQKAESALRAAVAKSDELQQKYGDAWDKVAALQQAKIDAKGDQEQLRAIAAAEAAENKRIGEACFAVYGAAIPPDATMSLRLSDGVVKGFPMNGTVAPPVTTLYGLFARHHEFGGKHPFDLPQVWLDKEKELDLKTPFNFTSTCDIIGGNSGSPIIDKDRNVVGLIFDGNIESLGNNFVFDDEVARAVSVHTAIIVESLRKIYGAAKLADELEQNGVKPAARDKKKVGAGDKLQKAQKDVAEIASGVMAWRAMKGAYPESLDALAQKDEKGRSMLAEVPKDPWGRAYELHQGDAVHHWEVVSVGPDGKIGTEDDVSSRSRVAAGK
jgi:hypothetical protein